METQADRVPSTWLFAPNNQSGLPGYGEVVHKRNPEDLTDSELEEEEDGWSLLLLALLVTSYASTYCPT